MSMSDTDRERLHEAGVTWDDNGRAQGFLIGRQAAIQDWYHRKEEKEFQRLIWRLRARKYWAAKDPERKARIQAYRRAWAEAHPERTREYNRKAKKKRRANPKVREREAAKRRAKRAVEREQRRASTVFTCQVCGTQWTPLGRLPSRPPRYCLPNGMACRSHAQYLRKKHGDDWREHISEHRIVWRDEA